MTKTPAIRFEHVSKAFGKLRVLDDVSFDITPGTSFCLLGRSGTGKSVMLKHIIGLLKPDNGRIFIDGEEITELESHELTRLRLRMGFLFQNAALFDSISVGENIAFTMRRNTKHSDSTIREIAAQKLASVGLDGEYEKMPSALSGGMRKRAGLARALALDPSILLVDEPSAGLDPITSREIDELLMGLKSNEGVTLVVVTHNIPSARRIGDELAMLHEGRIIARGSAAELDRSEEKLVKLFMQSEGSG